MQLLNIPTPSQIGITSLKSLKMTLFISHILLLPTAPLKIKVHLPNNISGNPRK